MRVESTTSVCALTAAGVRRRYRAAAAAWQKKQDEKEREQTAKPNALLGSKASQLSARRLERHGARMEAKDGARVAARAGGPSVNALPRGHPSAPTELARAAREPRAKTVIPPGAKASNYSLKAPVPAMGALPRGHPAAKHHQLLQANAKANGLKPLVT